MSNRMFYRILIFTILTGITGCDNFIDRLQLPWNQKEPSTPVARVFDKYLYADDIRELLPKDLSPEDSMRLANSYIDTWILTELLLDKAKLNLHAEELDISRQVEAYKTSLLIFRYKEQMLKSKLDTVVYPYEMEAYYEAHNDDFVLNENLIKAIYTKLPLEAPDVMKIAEKLGSNHEEDIDEVYNYCSLYAVKFKDFDNEWVSMNLIQKEWPVLLPDPQTSLPSVKIQEYNDGNFLYLVRIQDIMTKGKIAPYSYIKEKIKELILNKRKISFSSSIELELYEDALNKKKFEIYHPE